MQSADTRKSSKTDGDRADFCLRLFLGFRSIPPGSVVAGFASLMTVSAAQLGSRTGWSSCFELACLHRPRSFREITHRQLRFGILHQSPGPKVNLAHFPRFKMKVRGRGLDSEMSLFGVPPGCFQRHLLAAILPFCICCAREFVTDELMNMNHSPIAGIEHDVPAHLS
jgi:hypothetical protein